MTPARLAHVRLLVHDFSTSFRFYRDPRTEMAADVALRTPGDGALLVLDVGDVDSAAAALRERGVATLDEPHDHPEWGLRVLRVRDPDGSVVELFHDIEWTPE